MNYMIIALDLIVIAACIACGWMTYLDWRVNNKVLTLLGEHTDDLDAAVGLGDELSARFEALRLRVLKLEGKVIAVITGGQDAPIPQAPAPQSDTRA